MFSNRQQRVCLGLAAIICVGMVLFPPWRSYEQINLGASTGLQSAEDVGYHFVLSPPPPKPANPYVQTWVGMHVKQLLLQLLALAGALAGLLLMLRDRTTPDSGRGQADE